MAAEFEAELAEIIVENEHSRRRLLSQTAHQRFITPLHRYRKFREDMLY